MIFADKTNGMEQMLVYLLVVSLGKTLDVIPLLCVADRW